MLERAITAGLDSLRRTLGADPAQWRWGRINRSELPHPMLRAYDKKTGAEKWLVKRNYPCPLENDNGYTTPLLIRHEGREALLTWGAQHLTAHAADDDLLLDLAAAGVARLNAAHEAGEAV